MAKINLKHIYPHYEKDHVIEVPDDVAQAIRKAQLREKAQLRRAQRYKVVFTMTIEDCDLSEHLAFGPTPEDIVESQTQIEKLYHALNALPKVQARRVYAYYLLGMSQSEISRIEGVKQSSINNSIKVALRKLAKILETDL